MEEVQNNILSQCTFGLWSLAVHRSMTGSSIENKQIAPLHNEPPLQWEGMCTHVELEGSGETVSEAKKKRFSVRDVNFGD